MIIIIIHLSQQFYIQHYSSNIYMCDAHKSLNKMAVTSCTEDHKTNWTIVFSESNMKIIKRSIDDYVLDIAEQQTLTTYYRHGGDNQKFIFSEITCIDKAPVYNIIVQNKCIAYNSLLQKYFAEPCDISDNMKFILDGPDKEIIKNNNTDLPIKAYNVRKEENTSVANLHNLNKKSIPVCQGKQCSILINLYFNDAHVISEANQAGGIPFNPFYMYDVDYMKTEPLSKHIRHKRRHCIPSIHRYKVFY